MTDEELDPRVRGGETRKRRTREKLLRAADVVMQDEGLEATVQSIAEEAGVSTATFYSFYKSRNELCMDAFVEVILVPLENAGVSEQPFGKSVDALQRTCQQRQGLVAAALSGRYEKHRSVYARDGLVLEGTNPPSIFRLWNELTLGEEADFIDRTAKLLADREMLGLGQDAVSLAARGANLDIPWLLRSAALTVLDDIARYTTIGGHTVDRIVRPAFKAILEPPTFTNPS